MIEYGVGGWMLAFACGLIVVVLGVSALVSCFGPEDEDVKTK